MIIILKPNNRQNRERYFMKFENLRNPCNQEITEVELSEKELEYMSMLRLDVKFNKHKDFEMSIAERNKLYRKFGIGEFYENKDRFLLAISLINKITPYDTLKKVYDKYNLKECRRILNDIKNAPICNNKFFNEINETLISFCTKLNETFEQVCEKL